MLRGLKNDEAPRGAWASSPRALGGRSIPRIKKFGFHYHWHQICCAESQIEVVVASWLGADVNWMGILKFPSLVVGWILYKDPNLEHRPAMMPFEQRPSEKSRCDPDVTRVKISDKLENFRIVVMVQCLGTTKPDLVSKTDFCYNVVIMKHIIQVYVSKGDKYYVAEGVDLPIVTQGKTLDELVENIKEAIELHLEN